MIDGAKRALPDSLRGAVRSPAWISLTISVLLAWISFSQCPTSHFINNSGRSILSIIRTPALQRHAPHSQKCIAVGYWRSHCKFPCRPGSHFQPTPWVGWEGPVSLAPSPNALPAWDCQNVEAANYGPPGSHLAVGARAVWVGRSACPPEIWQEHGPLVLWSACGSLQPPPPPHFQTEPIASERRPFLDLDTPMCLSTTNKSKTTAIDKNMQIGRYHQDQPDNGNSFISLPAVW